VDDVLHFSQRILETQLADIGGYFIFGHAHPKKN
jgi:hypothetical protein